MSVMCSCANIGSGELREAFEAIVACNEPGEKITFKDVKEHLNLPERVREAHKDRDGKARCGSCMGPFMRAIKEYNETGDFDPLGRGRFSDNDNRDEDGLCNIAKSNDYRPRKRGDYPDLNPYPISDQPLVAAE